MTIDRGQGRLAGDRDMRQDRFLNSTRNVGTPPSRAPSIGREFPHYLFLSVLPDIVPIPITETILYDSVSKKIH